MQKFPDNPLLSLQNSQQNQRPSRTWQKIENWNLI